MNKFYVVWNYCDCYNIYLTKEKAISALRILKKRYDVNDYEYTEDILQSFSEINKKLYIFEVNEGETFGTELLPMYRRKILQDVYL